MPRARKDSFHPGILNTCTHSNGDLIKLHMYSRYKYIHRLTGLHTCTVHRQTGLHTCKVNRLTGLTLMEET